jgi:hypothetical protein
MECLILLSKASDHVVYPTVLAVTLRDHGALRNDELLQPISARIATPAALCRAQGLLDALVAQRRTNTRRRARAKPEGILGTAQQ